MARLIANRKKKKGNPSLLSFDIFFWCSSGLCGFTFFHLFNKQNTFKGRHCANIRSLNFKITLGGTIKCLCTPGSRDLETLSDLLKLPQQGNDRAVLPTKSPWTRSFLYKSKEF